MANRLPALLVVAGCMISLLSGCSYLSQQESAGPRTSDHIGPATPQIQPPQSPVSPPKSELPIPQEHAIAVDVASFSDIHHRSFQIELDRACNYVTPAKKIFKKNGLPPDLVYVALVESGFVPKARSRAHAVGMWQIIPQTGARLGLRENKWIDERCNPMKSAQAAADYLSRLYDTFGNWPLALAAYNAGENCVQGALDKSGLKTFWELAETGWLPAETRAYVPRVYAAIIVASHPDRYGFWYRPQHYVARYEKVTVPGGVKLAWVGKKIGVSKAELLQCNPELCKPMTPPCCSEYQLCVPRGCSDSVLASLANCTPCKEAAQQPLRHEFNPVFRAVRQTPRLAFHKVGHGDSWSSLARRYKCPASKLAAINHTRLSRRLKLGEVVKVPASSAPIRLAEAKTCRNGVEALLIAGRRHTGRLRRTSRRMHNVVAARTIRYKVNHGDTLWTIAERFHVPVKTLCTQNDLRPNQKIRPGAHIAIYADRRLAVVRPARRRE